MSLTGPSRTIIVQPIEEPASPQPEREPQPSREPAPDKPAREPRPKRRSEKVPG